VALEDRIMYVAAGKHLGQRMPDELAHAQLALGRAARMIAMLMACHSLDALSVMPGHSASKTRVNALMSGHPRL